MLIHADQLNGILSSRLLTVDDAERITGVSRFTWLDILGRRERRDANGYVNVEPETVRAIKKLLEVPPVFNIVLPRQGPPVRRKVPVDMVNPLFPTERLRAHEEREAQREADRKRKLQTTNEVTTRQGVTSNPREEEDDAVTRLHR